MMNRKMVHINFSTKQQKQRPKSAVLHNGSFITEAFPANSREVYDESEGGTLDSCLHYSGYNDSNVVVVDNLPHDQEMELQSTVIETEELDSVDQLFSICSNKQVEHIPVHAEDVPKEVEHLPYNRNTIISNSGRLSKVSTNFSDNVYSNSLINKSSATSLHNSVDMEDNSLGLSNSDTSIASVDGKTICSPATSAPVCIITTPDNLWNKPLAMTVPSAIVRHPTPCARTIEKAIDVPNKISSNLFKHCIVNNNNTSIVQAGGIDQNNAASVNKDDHNTSRVDHVDELPQLSSNNEQDSKIYPEEPLHFVNAVTTDDGGIELVDSDGRTFRIQPSEDSPTTASLSQQSAPEESAILESTYYRTALPVLDSVRSDEPADMLEPIDDESSLNVPPVIPTSNASSACLVPSSNDSQNCLQQISLTSETPVEISVAKPKGLISVPRRRGGWPKGKKRKSDRFRIKAPKTAYLLFAKKRRKELMIENPAYTFSEATVIMGKDWTALDSELKKEYQKLADQDQTRFNNELREYQQTEEYKTLLKRKRDETSAKLGSTMDEDLGYVEEEYTLFCHICDQRFSSRHNRKEHLAGRVHLKNLESELRKQQEPPVSKSGTKVAKEDENNKRKGEPECCEHCVNKMVGPSLDGPSMDVSLDINSHMESFLYRHSQRELEVQVLKENLRLLKDTNSQLSKELITVQENVVKVKQEIQSNKQWQMQLAASIDNLKMVPTLFGVINF